ncbi:MAG: hypothetical protein HGA96_06835 [Desulfobulbaceae bacterium]|nr:hypothetical protein [Desulfobulbaceae bacterium]
MMHKNLLRSAIATVMFFLGLWLAGCATTTPMKHLSSDVCLVMPESTTKAEVLSFLGEPDQKSNFQEGDELWIYYKKDQDFIHKMPLIGEQFGTLNYETVTISFIGNKVRTCIYRQLNQREFANFNRDHNTEITE